MDPVQMLSVSHIELGVISNGLPRDDSGLYFTGALVNSQGPNVAIQ